MKKQLLFTGIFIAILPSLIHGMDDFCFDHNAEFFYNFCDENNLPETTDLSTPQSPSYSLTTTNTALLPGIAPSASLSDDQIISFFTNEINSTIQNKRKNLPEESIEEMFAQEVLPIKKRAVETVSKNSQAKIKQSYTKNQSCAQSTQTPEYWTLEKWVKLKLNNKQTLIKNLLTLAGNNKQSIQAIVKMLDKNSPRCFPLIKYLFDPIECNGKNDSPVMTSIINQNNYEQFKSLLSYTFESIQKVQSNKSKINNYTHMIQGLQNIDLNTSNLCTIIATKIRDKFNSMPQKKFLKKFYQYSKSLLQDAPQHPVTLPLPPNAQNNQIRSVT